MCPSGSTEWFVNTDRQPWPIAPRRSNSRFVSQKACCFHIHLRRAEQCAGRWLRPSAKSAMRGADSVQSVPLINWSGPQRVRHPSALGRVRWPADRVLVHRAARRLGHPASIPRAIMSRSPEALAFGSRRHCIPASLSLPLCGCLLNRSRDCSRSRVPPRFSRRRYADAPAAASFSCLRFRFGTISPVTGGARNWRRDPR